MFLNPKPEGEGLFSPSSFSRLMAVPQKTNYKPTFQRGAQEQTNQGKTVLVLCTEKGAMEMTNGRKFKTGNHPFELFVPLLHLKDSGIPFQFVTLTGAPVVLEEWALPHKDDKVMDFFRDLSDALKKPLALEAAYAIKEQCSGVFIPGGHGAMLDLPKSETVGQLLKDFLTHKKVIATLCHGPAVLLAAGESFKGYTISAFPDVMDKLTPTIGYLPGPMPWYFGVELKKRGLKIKKSLGMGSCHRDRQLVSGDGPQAANKFGIMMVEALRENS
jgi:molecular chaperone Hsp31 and glyoxalase 3